MDYIFERGKFTESELEAAIIELFKKVKDINHPIVGDKKYGCKFTSCYVWL